MLSTSSLEKVLASFLVLPDAAAAAALASVTADADANPEAPLPTVSSRPTFAADRGCKAAAATLLTDEHDIRSYIYTRNTTTLPLTIHPHVRARHPATSVRHDEQQVSPPSFFSFFFEKKIQVSFFSRQPAANPSPPLQTNKAEEAFGGKRL